MTTGRGIIHGENVMTKGKVRLLQLWLTLPKDQRWTTPGFQTIQADAVPVRREAGVEVRIYSGASGSLRSTTRNHVPVTMTEIKMDPHTSIDQELPTSYNGFAYLINGSVQVGDAVLNKGQVGWLDRPLNRPNDWPYDEGRSVLHVVSGEDGARLVLYAGQPQGDTIVSHGPFIGDSKEDIVRLYTEYRAGEFVRMTELARQDG
jgi:quercetin 2,3-dioxygenase